MTGIQHRWAARLAALALVGACEGEAAKAKDDTLYEDCLTVIAKNDTCMNQVFEGCDGCQADCADRGHDVAAKDEHCGELFAATYACLAALPCEEFLQWHSHPDPNKPYPCQAEETAFRGDCPDFHLYNDNN